MKLFAVGLLIGGLIGLWFGVNIGKERPLTDNPLQTSIEVQHVVARV